MATGTGYELVVAVVGTFLLATAFYAATAHVAARWVLGETPVSAAIGVGVVPALVTVLLDPLGPAVVVPLAIAGDGFAIHGLYDCSRRETVGFVVVHVVVSLALGIALFNLVRLLG